MGKSNPIHNQQPPTSGEILLDNITRDHRNITIKGDVRENLGDTTAVKGIRKEREQYRPVTSVQSRQTSSIRPPDIGTVTRRARPATQSGSQDPFYKNLNDASSAQNSTQSFIRRKKTSEGKPKGGSHTRKKPRMKSKIKNTRRRFTKEKLRKTIKRNRGSGKRNRTEIKKARPASAPASVGSKSSNDNTLQ
jgi:hypothetical protein